MEQIMYTHGPHDKLSDAAIAVNLTSNTITTKDGTVLYYKDWGVGPAIVFSHGYPLSSDAWEYQMMFLLQNGYRVIAHDRRSSAIPWAAGRRSATSPGMGKVAWPGSHLSGLSHRFS
jgi:hypothetical protein